MSEGCNDHTTSNTRLIPFLFETDTMVRITDQVGKPWYVATDVCRPVGFKNTAQAVKRLDDDEKGIIDCDTPGGIQKLLVVSEGGMYAIVLRSNAAMTPGTKAHRFRRWVTDELIPQVRRTGTYQVPGLPTFADKDREAEPSTEMKNTLINTACRVGGAQSGAELWLQFFPQWSVAGIRYAATRPHQMTLFEIPGFAEPSDDE
jgi:prophage antirepressor-like protein